MPRLTKQDKIWRAEEDAHTLARAKIIMGDITRLASAKQAAERMAEKEREEASAMTDVSNLKTNSRLSPASKPSQSTKRKSPPKNPHNVFERI